MLLEASKKIILKKLILCLNAGKRGNNKFLNMERKNNMAGQKRV